MSGDSMERIKGDMVEFMVKQSREQFDKGAMAVIEILREAMKVSELNYVPAQWLDTAEKEVKKIREKKK